MSKSRFSTRRLATAGIIAGIYAALTLFLPIPQYGGVQLRVAEAMTVLPFLFPEAVPGLAVGCFLANLLGSPYVLDWVFGTLATFLGALWCRRFRSRPALALFGFVLANALIVPLYLPILLQGLGYYTIPFTSISLEGMYIPMYLFGVVAVGIGEALVMYILGLPLLRAIRKFGVAGDEG